jgi:hypothetical protein
LNAADPARPLTRRGPGSPSRITLLKKPPVIAIARVVSGNSELASTSVGPSPYGAEEINLPDIPQANPSTGDLKRDARASSRQTLKR